jgi:hypothetical protein
MSTDLRKSTRKNQDLTRETAGKQLVDFGFDILEAGGG